MKKTFSVAKWEFLEKVKTKAFIISLIVTPMLIIALSILPTLLSGQEDNTTKAIGIVDTSGFYFRQMADKLESYKLANNQPNYLLINLAAKHEKLRSIKKEADSNTLDNRIEGYLLILNAGTDSVKLEYRSRNVGNFRDIKRFEDAFNNIRIQRQLIKSGVDTSLMNMISANVEVEPIKIEKGGKESKTDFTVVFFSSFIFIMLLMIMILYSGGMLIRSLVEEKSNRIIEILISSCSADELLAGKILGLSALGMTQILVWALVGISLVGSSAIPPTAFDHILPMLGYFILGFVFYTAIFVGVGSIVTTEQEAQQITSYISILLAVPIALSFPAIQNPNSLLIQVLSYIPLTLPSIMMIRLNSMPVPITEIFSTLVIMIASIYIVIVISSKIFRIAILSYGKKPSMKEVMGWIKAK
jgi:ABC-2 type transport system permease protein